MLWSVLCAGGRGSAGYLGRYGKRPYCGGSATAGYMGGRPGDRPYTRAPVQRYYTLARKEAIFARLCIATIIRGLQGWKNQIFFAWARSSGYIVKGAF